MQHVDALSRAPVALLLSTDLILDAQRQSRETFTSKAITTSAEGLKEIKIHGRKRIVIPKHFRLDVLKEAHDNSGHPGIRKTQTQIAYNYWWLQMRHDIKLNVQSLSCLPVSKTCHSCNLWSTPTAAYTRTTDGPNFNGHDCYGILSANNKS